MKEVIEWEKSGVPMRHAVCELCGWATKSGDINATGKRIAATAWDDLTLVARNVLVQHGITR